MIGSEVWPRSQGLMKRKITRRTGIKWAAAGSLMGLRIPVAEAARDSQLTSSEKRGDPWSRTHDRIWLGGEFWANPMEDWCIRDGAAECLNPGGGRSVHSLAHQITKNGDFTMSVTVTRVEAMNKDGGAGFRI